MFCWFWFSVAGLPLLGTSYWFTAIGFRGLFSVLVFLSWVLWVKFSVIGCKDNMLARQALYYLSQNLLILYNRIICR